MSPRTTFFLSAVLLGTGALSAQAQAPDSPPAKIVLATRAVEIAADGSSVQTTHNETKVLQPAAVSSLAQAALGYVDQIQQLDITEAYTLKADGRRIPVLPDAIITQQSPVAAGSPLLSDLKQKVILFPNVEVGDMLVYGAVSRSRALLPGAFFSNVVVPASVPIDNSTVTYSVPKDLPVTTEAHGLDVRKTEQGDRVIYSIQYSNPAPATPSPQAVSEFDRAARFAISTFKDYDALAKTYGALALPMIAVTPTIQGQADLITKGVSDRREQARMIYEWVAARVRYVAVEFGQGQFVPHSADSVLSNAYGDCKDHAVLFSALLKAKGIDSNLVIINGNDSYSISGPPGTTPFTHMITWLPEFKLYADTTNGRAVPFGLLPRTEYGKQVIHIGDPKGALHQVPVAGMSTDTYKLTIRLDDAGHMELESSTTGTGDFAVPLRAFGAAIQGDNGRAMALSVLAKSSMPNATGAFMAPPPDLGSLEYTVSATYAPPQPLVLAAGSNFKMGDNLQFLQPVTPVFFGPVLEDRYRGADPAPCYSGHAVDDETMEFPDTRHIDKLPADSSVKTAHVSYVSHWSQTATSINVHREFNARFDQALCTGAVRQEVLSAYDHVRGDVAGASFALPHN